MSCKLENERPDWKAYALGELETRERQDAERHAASCEVCQEEMAELQLTLSAMAALKEEEVPRRIAFVSDKVFEPTLWQKMTQFVLRPAFAGGALVAAAIVAHAFLAPSNVPIAAPTQAYVGAIASQVREQVTRDVTEQITQQVRAEMAAKMDVAIQQAVMQAVADTQKTDDRRTANLLAATERRYQETADMLNRQVSRMYAFNTGAGSR
jgi:anti-sigma factor RsiW